MNLLLTVGLFLSFLVCIFGNDDQKPNIWHPGQSLALKEYDRPQELPEADYYEIYEKKVARIRHPRQNLFPQYRPPVLRSEGDRNQKLELLKERITDWLIQKTGHFLEERKPENQLSENSNNFYFKIVQNFFFNKPINQVKPSHNATVVKCRKNQDCKKHGHHCENGVCKLKPHHPRHCKIDLDCKLRIPSHFYIQHLPMYCDKGHCKIGNRKPSTPKPTLPPLPTTQTTDEPTTLPLTKRTKKPRHCNKDSDCLNRGTLKIYLHNQHCENGVCKKGRRPTSASTTSMATTQAPITEVSLPETTTTTATPPRYCQKDSDCLKFVEFRHKMLVSVFCVEGLCSLNKPPTEVPTVQSSTEPPLTTQKDELETTTAFSFPSTCTFDEDCSLPIGIAVIIPEIPVNHRPVYCDAGQCKFGSRKITVSTTQILPEAVIPTDESSKLSTLNPSENFIIIKTFERVSKHKETTLNNEEVSIKPFLPTAKYDETPKTEDLVKKSSSLDVSSPRQESCQFDDDCGNIKGKCVGNICVPRTLSTSSLLQP